jgi:hypothetical protein
MKSVSQAFKEAIASDHPSVMREVSYKRRYWSQAVAAYVWESSWTTISESDVGGVSAITEKLDTERLNEFKASNITITVKNHDNRWREDNRAGLFGPDSTSPLYHYSAYWTKFRVRLQVRLADGTDEYVTMFSGLAIEFNYESENVAQITVQGLESLLINAKAEEVSTRVVNETLTGTVNGSNTEFTTAQVGVGIVEEVSINGIKKKAGTQYNLSQMNEQSLSLKVTFTTAPTVGQIPRITYRYWKQDQTIEDLVEDLLDEAGIPSVDQIIDSVIFPGSITNTFIQESQADWLAGTLTRVEATSSPGDLKIDPFSSANSETLDDFTDGDYTASPAWTVRSGSVSVSSGKLSQSNARIRMDTPSTRTCGYWAFTFNRTSVSSLDEMRFYFMAGAYNAGMTLWANSYFIRIYISGAGTEVVLMKTIGTAASTIASSTQAPNPSGDKLVEVIRKSNGAFSVYYGGSLIISASDSSNSTGSFIGLEVNSAGAGSITVDSLKYPKESLTGEWISDSFDIGFTPTAFGLLLYLQTIVGSGSGTFYTRVSTDDATWDAWIEIADNGQVQSDLKRYLQVKWVPAASSTGTNDVTLHSLSMNYTTTSTTIAMANFTGKTVYQAIQGLGQFTNYEWGFTADEEFFFRSKRAQQDEDIILTRPLILKISGLKTGQDRVYSEVKATYGSFSSVLTAQGDSPEDPRAKFGDRVLEIDGGDILVNDDADIATGVAAIFFSDFSRAKRTFKATCKLLPQIDLSDVALVTFDQNQPPVPWFHGDESRSLGETVLNHYGAGNQLIAEMYAKVIGARHDPDNAISELDFEEVLT